MAWKGRTFHFRACRKRDIGWSYSPIQVAEVVSNCNSVANLKTQRLYRESTLTNRSLFRNSVRSGRTTTKLCGQQFFDLLILTVILMLQETKTRSHSMNSVWNVMSHFRRGFCYVENYKDDVYDVCVPLLCNRLERLIQISGERQRESEFAFLLWKNKETNSFNCMICVYVTSTVANIL